MSRLRNDFHESGLTASISVDFWHPNRDGSLTLDAGVRVQGPDGTQWETFVTIKIHDKDQESGDWSRAACPPKMTARRLKILREISGASREKPMHLRGPDMRTAMWLYRNGLVGLRGGRFYPLTPKKTRLGDQLRDAGLPDNASLVDYLIGEFGDEAWTAPSKLAYDWVRENDIPGCCVSEALTFLREHQRLQVPKLP